MTCPHCGYHNDPGAEECLSCGYRLAPPKASRTSGLRPIVVVVLVLGFIAAFVAAIIAFGRRADSMVSFFGKRAYFDLAAGPLVIPPGEVKAYSLRIPVNTPVCRIYGRVAGTAPGAAVIVLDSLNYASLRAGGSFTALSTTTIAGNTGFSATAQGANLEHYVVFTSSPAATDTTRLTVERLQAACFERW